MQMNPLKRTKETIRTVAEFAGIVSPNVVDATAAAAEHRQSLTAATAALDAAELALQAAHDRGDDSDIGRLEAGVAAAKLEATRAEARYRGAEKRLEKARDAESAAQAAAARVKLNAALALRAKAAIEIERLAPLIAAQVQLIDAQADPIREAQRDGAGPREVVFTISGKRAAELALSKAGAIPSAYSGNQTEHPGAVDVVMRDNGIFTAA